jgi:hypothetical protein
MLALNKVFSVRNPLQGELVEFVRSSGFSCPHMDILIRDLVCLLGNYREEDVPLFPEVFVMLSVLDLKGLAPGTERLRIGAASLDDRAATTILKNCATLAVRGWAIYVAKVSEKTAEFGLFRALRYTFAAHAAELMVQGDGTNPAILIRNRGYMVVALRNARAEEFTAAFTSAPATESPFSRHVTMLTQAACSSMADSACEPFLPYMQRLLLDQLQRCHGTLLAVYAPPTDGACPVQFSDGVWLSAPLDLATAYATATNTKNADSLAALQANEALLAGMLNSDGVVVFGTNGTVLGYRIFLKPDAQEKEAASHKGGGRRRTFELMRGRLGTEFKAAFCCSQDGETECARLGS